MKIELPSFVKKLLYALPNSVVFHLRFLWKHGYWPNLNNPRSLMEKIVWLMVWDENPLRALVVDRIKVRKFVQEHAPDCKTPEQLWVGEDLTLEVWNNLPREFVLKANHGSHMTYVVDKLNDSFDDVVKMSKTWQDKDYSSDFGEWVYKDLPRALIAEEKLTVEGKIPPDWKFYCTNGKVLLIHVDMDRFERHLRNLYLPDFSRVRYDLYPPGSDIDKPPCFNDALCIAKQLSVPFDFIRVDLYFVGESVYFGEMTCYPGGGVEPLASVKIDFELGSQIVLDKSFVNSVPRSIWTNFSEKGRQYDPAV